MDVNKQVYVTYSADLCAMKGKEEDNKYPWTHKQVTWSWFSSTSECVILTINDDLEYKLTSTNQGTLPKKHILNILSFTIRLCVEF